MTPARLALMKRRSEDWGLTDGEARELIAAIREKDQQIAKLREALGDILCGLENADDGTDDDFCRPYYALLAATAPEGEHDG